MDPQRARELMETVETYRATGGERFKQDINAALIHQRMAGGERCRAMADEVFMELESIGTGWNEDDIERIQTSLLPRIHDLLNLIAIGGRNDPPSYEHC